MKDFVPRPPMVRQAALQSESRSWFSELFTFAVVFLVSLLVQLLLSFIGELVYVTTLPETLLDSPEYLTMESTVSALTMISLFSSVGLVGCSILYCRLIEKRELSTMGIVKTGAIREYMIGLAVGLVMSSLAVGLATATGAVSLRPAASVSVGFILAMFLGHVFQGAGEELLCRGYLCVSLAKRCTLQAAVLISSLVFSLLHIISSGISALAIINLTLFGIFCAVYMLCRGNIWGVCAFHTMWNFVQGNVFGTPASSEIPDSTLFRMEVSSATALNGGTFGLEGGLCATFVLTLGIALLLLLRRHITPAETEDSQNAPIA